MDSNLPRRKCTRNFTVINLTYPIEFVRAFYNGPGQSHEICSFGDIIPSCFHIKLFLSK